MKILIALAFSMALGQYSPYSTRPIRYEPQPRSRHRKIPVKYPALAFNPYAMCLHSLTAPKANCSLDGQFVIATPGQTCDSIGLQLASFSNNTSDLIAAFSTLDTCGLSTAIVSGQECSAMMLDRKLMIAELVIGLPQFVCGDERIPQLCQSNVPSATTMTIPTGTQCIAAPQTCTFNSISSGNFTLLNVTVPFSQASSACIRFGMTPAAVDISNFLSAVDTVLNCSGKRSQAWVQSWNGDSYQGACLALSTGDQSGGGAINPLDCNLSLPILCSSVGSSSTNFVNSNCTVQEYTLLTLPVNATDASEACSRQNMTLAQVIHESENAAAQVISQCGLLNQTVWAGGYEGMKVSDDLCVSVGLINPNQTIGLIPVLPCQCSQFKAVLCESVSQNVTLEIPSIKSSDDF